jgi:hypothetical protein
MGPSPELNGDFVLANFASRLSDDPASILGIVGVLREDLLRAWKDQRPLASLVAPSKLVA